MGRGKAEASQLLYGEAAPRTGATRVETLDDLKSTIAAIFPALCSAAAKGLTGFTANYISGIAAIPTFRAQEMLDGLVKQGHAKRWYCLTNAKNGSTIETYDSMEEANEDLSKLNNEAGKYAIYTRYSLSEQLMNSVDAETK